MAILSGGPNSGFSGKAGSVVGYYRLGKWIIRGLPRESPRNKKGSAKQNVRRSRFTQIQRFLKPIIPFIRVGFNLEARKNGNTAHNSATSWNLLHAFNEIGELDYSKTRVSMGLLGGAEEAAVHFEDRNIIFTWRDNSDPRVSRSIVPEESDQVMLLAYHTQSGEIVQMLSGARRSACWEALEIPSDIALEASEWHTWIAFISDDRMSISNSEYLGLVKLTKVGA